MMFGLAPYTRRVLGYVRDALIIAFIVTAGTYILWNPEKVDAFMNWLLRQP